ncbi:MAG: hypothetical protein JST04_14690 [Bdellovibrionales bacterium]|nr:hypothetical protein [Bdellovibrionales bacterium]
MRALISSLFLTLLLTASTASADFRSLYKEGKFAEALSELEQSPDAAQKNYAYYLNRGLIYHALNQDALAVANLSKAKAMDPYGGRDVEAPLAEATAGLVKWLGLARLDATSYGFETAGDFLPLDLLFFAAGGLSILAWLGFFLFPKRRRTFMSAGWITLAITALFGGWSAWNDAHPLVIVTESRLVKSGPGETFLDRGAVEVGMKLRVVGSMIEPAKASASGATTGSAPAARWWKVRFDERHDLGFLPERSGLLLTDESNTPGT